MKANYTLALARRAPKTILPSPRASPCCCYSYCRPELTCIITLHQVEVLCATRLTQIIPNPRIPTPTRRLSSSTSCGVLPKAYWTRLRWPSGESWLWPTISGVSSTDEGSHHSLRTLTVDFSSHLKRRCFSPEVRLTRRPSSSTRFSKRSPPTPWLSWDALVSSSRGAHSDPLSRRTSKSSPFRPTTFLILASGLDCASTCSTTRSERGERGSEVLLS